jgi:hypothetical protein
MAFADDGGWLRERMVNAPSEFNVFTILLRNGRDPAPDCGDVGVGGTYIGDSALPRGLPDKTEPPVLFDTCMNERIGVDGIQDCIKIGIESEIVNDERRRRPLVREPVATLPYPDDTVAHNPEPPPIIGTVPAEHLPAGEGRIQTERLVRVEGQGVHRIFPLIGLSQSLIILFLEAANLQGVSMGQDRNEGDFNI